MREPFAEAAPEPSVHATEHGFEVTRAVVDGSMPPRILLVRDFIGADGSYAYEIVKTLVQGPRVEDLLWHPH